MRLGRKNHLLEHQYRLLVEQVSDGIVIATPQGAFLEVNNRMCKMTGYTRDEFLHGNGWDLMTPKDPDAHRVRFDSLRQGESIQASRRMIRKDGTTIHTEIAATMLDADTVQAIIRDVTEQRRSEEALRESEANYRRLFEYANDSIFLVDVETNRFIDVNRIAVKRLGYTREELLQLQPEDIDLPLDKGEMRAIRRELVTTGTLVFEHAHRRKDGTIIPVESSSRVIEYGGRKAVLNFARDISQRKAAEEAERDQRMLAEALSATAASLSSTLNLDEVVNRVLDQVTRVVPCDTANIMLVDAGIARIVGQRGYAPYASDQVLFAIGLPVDYTTTLLTMVETGQPLIVADTRSFKNWVSVPKMDWIRSSVAAPIHAEGRVIGFIHLDSAVPDTFNETHAQRLQAFANQASIAIQNAQLFQAVQRYAIDLEQKVVQRTAELSETNQRLLEQIEERARAEQALAEERNLLRTLIDHLPDDIYVKDTHSRFLLMNRASVRSLGVASSDDIIGKTDRDFFPSELAEDFVKAEQQIVETGQPIMNYEHVRDGDSDQKTWELVTKVPLRDSQGRITGIVGINHNVTELKRAQAALAEERNLLRTVIDNIPDAIYVKDREGRYLLVNAVVLSRFALSGMEDMIGKTDLDFFPKDEAQALLEIERRIFETGSVYYGDETKIVDTAGHERWIIGTKIPLRDKQGKIAGLVGINHDITPRKQAEMILAEERNLLRTIIDNVPDMVYAKDPEGRFIMVNTAGVRRLGFSRAQQIIGRTIHDLKPSEAARPYSADDLAVLQTGVAIVNREVLEADETGNKRWSLITTTPLRDSHDEIAGLLGISHDITELKQAEEQVLQVFSSARCLMWYAIVENIDGNYKWNLHVSNEDAAQRFLPLEIAPGQSYTDAWRASRSPEDRAEIKRVSTAALQSGRAAYTQEFRCRQADGRFRWLNEDVVVKPLTPGRWSLVGICTDITERKGAEDELLATQERLRFLLSVTPVVIYSYRAYGDRQATFVSDRVGNLLGYQPDDFTSDSTFWMNHLHPEDRERVFVQGNRVREEGRNTFEYRFQCSDGTYKWISDENRVVRDSNGNPVEVIGYWIDISARRQAEDELRKAYDELERRVQERTAELSRANAELTEQITERRRAEEAERDQRVLAEALRDAASGLGGTLDMNEVMDRILNLVARVVPHDAANIILIEDGIAYTARYRGYARPDLSARFPLDHLPDFKRMIETGQPRVVADTRLYPDWWNLPEVARVRSNVAAPIKIAANVLGFILLDSASPGSFTGEHAERLQAFANQAGIAIDNARLYAAVQRYAGELELRVVERTAELEREGAQLQAILDAMGEGVIGVIGEHETPTRFASRAFTELTGFTAEEWSKVYFRTDAMADDEFVLLQEEVERHLALRGLWKSDLKLKRKDGSLIDVSATSTTISDQYGKPIGSVTILRDISQEKILQDQQARFIANASHELRTPLANIKTRLYLIPRQPGRLDEHLRVMELVANRMKALIEDMLDVSRFERGMISLVPQPVILQTVVSEVLNVQQPEAQLKNIHLHSQMPDIPLLIQADPRRITQVMTNLIVNAINYTPEGGEISIHLDVNRHGEYPCAVIRIEDSGFGIAQELLPHVFKPFFRASENTVGMGLGLTIAKEIVERHHGEITVESEVDGGSRFTVRLPLAGISSGG